MIETAAAVTKLIGYLASQPASQQRAPTMACFSLLHLSSDPPGRARGQGHDRQTRSISPSKAESSSENCDHTVYIDIASSSSRKEVDEDEEEYHISHGRRP